ncbi:hypothetical protein PUN28_017141 [Cardiocondyla obscurior]|uniref:Uncharacterized protein n=1 Tax=Cardiocondyla obscurior TaxID=286306 RepID=A0AAW2EM49_9HYME
MSLPGVAADRRIIETLSIPCHLHSRDFLSRFCYLLLASSFEIQKRKKKISRSNSRPRSSNYARFRNHEVRWILYDPLPFEENHSAKSRKRERYAGPPESCLTYTRSIDFSSR